MSFQFRFEQILTMKEKETEAALNEMNVFKYKQETVEKDLLELVERKESYIDSYTVKKSLTVNEIQEREEYIYFLDKQIEKMRKKLAELTKEVNLKKDLLLVKNQEEKIWHNWREKSFVAYQEQQKREEQNSLDEMAVIRYFHSRN